MILPVLLLAAVQDVPGPWTDAQVLHAGGDTFLLTTAIDDALFASPALNTQVRRIGLPAACAIARETRDAAVTTTTPAFRKALVRTMRTMIPAERLTGVPFPAFHHLPAYKMRVADALKLDAASGVSSASGAALWRFEQALAAAPATTKPWADIFWDWDLDRPFAVRSACLQYRLKNPAEGKLVFDGFYQRRPAPPPRSPQ